MRSPLALIEVKTNKGYRWHPIYKWDGARGMFIRRVIFIRRHLVSETYTVLAGLSKQFKDNVYTLTDLLPENQRDLYYDNV